MRLTLATLVGIFLALFGAPVIALFGPKLERSFGTIVGSIVGLSGIVAIVVITLTVVFRFEHQSLASLGLRPLRWQSVALGLALAAFFMYVFTPAVVWMLSRLPFGGFESGLAKTAAVPSWLLAITVLIVATAEEILYRGYAVERLAGFTESYWIAGAISVVVFGVAHIPNWGLGAAMSTFLSGAVLTAFYIWQRDLTANIVAHVVTDVMGIIVMPAFAQSKPS